MKIVSSPEYNYSGLVLNRYLKEHTGASEHGLQDIGHYYAEFGWNYGIDYLWAFAQMLHETNFLRFGGDVTPDQYNFAGLGTTGGGVKGDYYAGAIAGVKAHILHLAAYAGFDYRDDLVSQADGSQSRTQIVFDWVYGTAQTIEGLTMKWATDGGYYKKIKGIYDRLISAIKQYRHSEIVVGMGDGYKMKYALLIDGKTQALGQTNDVSVLKKDFAGYSNFRHCYDNEQHFEMYPYAEQVIREKESGRSDDGREDATLEGHTIVLDPGHSEKYPGASGLPPDKPEEEDLNRLQASIIASRLKEKGAKVIVHDPLEDDLWDIGQKARGASMFISLHHNAYDADGRDEYSCVMVHRKYHRQEDINFASKCAKKIAKAIDNPIFRGKMPEYPEGVYPAGLTVLNSAISTGCPCCVLTESYFIDDYGSWKVAEDRSRKSAHAIADAVIEWFGA